MGNAGRRSLSPHGWVFEGTGSKLLRRAPALPARALVHANSARDLRSVSCRLWQSRSCYDAFVYAQKFVVDVIVRGERRACPLEWLDQFCMRNFTNSADFDDTLPVADGRLEASFRLTPGRFAEGLAAWLNQRGKGEGQSVQVEVRRDGA
jgi:hypothetical protein